MLRKRKNIIAAVAAAVMLLVAMLPAATAFAADLSDTLDFITSVSLTDLAGNPLGENIPKDSDLKLAYEYAIPNEATVLEGDTFTLHIPDEIAITAPGAFELTDDNTGLVIGNGTIATDGTLVITFTHYVQEYSNIHGNFWFDLAFDEDNIGDDDPYYITFEVGASTDPFVVEVNFDQPAAPDPTIVKTGSFNAATKQITWTVTVNPEDVEVANAVVTDTIAEGQTYVVDSLTVNGNPADLADYTYDPGTATLTYSFPGTIFTEQVLTFKTTVEDSEFSGSSEGATLTEHNTAQLTRDGGGDVSNDATITTTVDFIRKNGSYDGANKRILWTIIVDSNYVYIPDAVITDYIPEGLTFDIGTIAYDGDFSGFPIGTAIYYNDVTRILEIDLGEPISEPHTITFYTDVDEDFFIENQYQLFTNDVTIEGTGVPENTEATRGVGVTSSIVSKAGTGYQRSTGQISWRITVNSNQIDIENCWVTDDIRTGQEFITGSVYIDGNPATESVDFTYTSAVPGDPDKTGTLTFSFGTTSSMHTIEFKTQITDPAVYMSNVNTTYRNTAKSGGDNIPESSSEGTQNVTSQVVNKTSTDYNYETREITWRIVVNANENDLSNVIVTDNIRNGQEFVENSVTYDGSTSPEADYTYTPLSGDPNYSSVLVYDVGDVPDQHIITFKTHISDLSIFNTNGDKTLSNSATLVHGLLPGGVTSTGNRTVHNTVISKTGDYTSGNKYIDWTIIINTNTVPLSDAVITDTFQEGLQLDTNTIELNHMTVNPDGSLSEGAEVVLDADSIEYDFSTRTLTFTIPDPVTGSYRLTFRTNVTDKNQSPFTNSASFSGTGTEQTDTTDQIAVSWAGSGSTGTGETGSIRVYKVDSRDDAHTLEGCTFELLDRFGIKVDEQTTGSDGSALFEMLRFDVDYTVREVTPPTGYLLSDEEYTFQIHGVDEVYDIEYRYADDVIMGSILLYKYDMDMNPVPGTEFTLYAADDTDYSDPLMIAMSGEDGSVLFENVEYGSYAILETTPAPGHYGSSTVLYATVSEDGTTVTTTPEYLQNEAYRGSISLLKTQEDAETPLEGAVLGLYLPEDTDYSDPVATDTSDIDGAVLFEDVPYGDYIIREISAPAGYVRTSSTISVSVTQDGETVDGGVFVNRRRSPRTGDDILTYVAIFALCAAGLAALALTGRRRRAGQKSKAR